MNRQCCWLRPFIRSQSKKNTTSLPQPCTLGRCMDNVTQVQKFHSVPNHSDGPSPASGLIPGMTAAAIFIVFLLGLYTILWKCMSFQTKRHRGSGRSKLRAAHVSC
ncbi:uncharacterized protein sb:cb288 isoform X1 [Mobula hypostoma]|uniref:uncharacterized protein sb:cb288 isoform X1 n=1 Tax=Mobula hypostoma TaxID=723540 RepID=UPI002FC3D43C